MNIEKINGAIQNGLNILPELWVKGDGRRQSLILEELFKMIYSEVNAEAIKASQPAAGPSCTTEVPEKVKELAKIVKGKKAENGLDSVAKSA